MDIFEPLPPEIMRWIDGGTARANAVTTSVIAMEVLPIPLGDQISFIAFWPDATPSIRIVAW